MAERLTDFYCGATKRWRVVFPQSIVGCLLYFRMARSLTQASADLEISAVLDGPDAGGDIFGATFEISAGTSAQLAPHQYFTEHEIVTATGEVTPFLPQTIKVMARVPKGP